MMNISKKQFRQTAVSLLALLLLASCGGKDFADGSTPTDDTKPDTETAVTDLTDGRPALGLSDMDFGGVPYRISCFQESDQQQAMQMNHNMLQHRIHTDNTTTYRNLHLIQCISR